MKWAVNLIKSNGEIRKQYSSWSIPKNIREECSINDGMICKITAKLGDYEVTRHYKITSGGEFRIPKQISDKIKLKRKLSKSIIFFIDLTSNIQSKFEDAVSKSSSDSQNNRKKRLNNARIKPTTNITTTIVFNRNPDVVAEVLYEAEGICGTCHEKAPFNRRSDDSPYLEVHHKIQLADGGEDTVENAIALCPNCHRRKHYG